MDIDVARLKVLKADHQSQQYRMEDKLLKYFPAEIEKQTGYIHGFEADIKTVEAHPQIADGFAAWKSWAKPTPKRQMPVKSSLRLVRTRKVPIRFLLAVTVAFRWSFRLTVSGTSSM